MKLSELKPCAACKGKLVPIWYVVRVTQAMVNASVANEVLSLVMRFGANDAGLAVAEAMAPEPDCVMILGDKEKALMTELHICQSCFIDKFSDLAVLVEKERCDGTEISSGGSR